MGCSKGPRLKLLVILLVCFHKNGKTNMQSTNVPNTYCIIHILVKTFVIIVKKYWYVLRVHTSFISFSSINFLSQVSEATLQPVATPPLATLGCEIHSKNKQKTWSSFRITAKKWKLSQIPQFLTPSSLFYDHFSIYWLTDYKWHRDNWYYYHH